MNLKVVSAAMGKSQLTTENSLCAFKNSFDLNNYTEIL